MSEPAVARVACIPEDALAAEIEFAIAYVVAARRDLAPRFLIPEPDGARGYFAGQIAAMLAERAEKGLSGMASYELRAGHGHRDALTGRNLVTE